MDNLEEFRKHISQIQDQRSERIVRLMCGKVVSNCPITLLIKLSNIIADYREQELVNNET